MLFELGFVLWGCVALISVLAASHYLLGKETAAGASAVVLRAVAWSYGEAKDVIGTVTRRGWRPLIPWMFVAFMGVLIWRVALGLPLVNVPELATALVPLAGASGLMGWFRSREVISGVANVVRDAATVSFRVPDDALPRPAQ